mgnify:CR=1 FL=1
MNVIEKVFGTHSERELKRILPIVDKIESLRDDMMALTDEQLKDKTKEYKTRLAQGETLDDLLPEAYATVREAGRRVLNMEHFRVQLIGGIILHQGRIAEMKTGEGKTLVSTLPAYLNALEGKGVHVVTVNDYLAARDAEWMGAIHEFLGLKVGIVLNSMKPEERKAAYACDITYVTNNELGFDYLRDNMAIYKEQLVLRDLHYAIIDEVDSVLIDEARTPLIISGQSGKSTSLYEACDILARQLKRGDDVGEFSKMDAIMGIEQEENGDFVVNEKDKVVNLTAEGIEKVEKFFHIENLADPENLEIQNNIILALRAHNLMHRDKDYVVKEDQVLIVDEFTGRIMPGRRYSDGLHQAIEAKEHVKVKRESKTLATITFQNYFRLYGKLSGMTGTALTEEEEFRHTYQLDVIEIPTNKPVARKDNPDAVYKNERGKIMATIARIEQCHAKGQPILVGTVSIEKSEELSKILKAKGIKHTVLNAKYHEREAEIVAQAGKPGAVTIATNMAGRGTDIMLGGNAETMALDEIKKYLRHEVEDRVQKGEMDERVAHDYIDHMIYEANGHADTDDQEVLAIRAKFEELYSKFKTETDAAAEKVRAAGGLYILGTERHESRRIDNQLRGRAGRQGDPGESSFYISLEDDLMRLFGSERIQNMMDTLGIADDEPIDQKILSGAIENAQKKIESRNFGVRKHVLEYDDVLNTQRQTIYAQRLQVLEGKDVKDNIVKMIDDTIAHAVHAAIGEHSLISTEMVEQARRPFIGVFLRPEDCTFTPEECDDLTADQLTNILSDQAHKVYEAKEQALGSPIMRELERVVLLKNVDSKWMDHIDAMTELRNGIGLRAYGQYDPVVEYKREGFDMFDAMIDSIREDTVRMIFLAQVRTREEPKREQVAKETGAAGATDGSVKAEPKRAGKKPGPNDPCPCGSGKKYKKCCYLKPDDPYK